mmetsp:Transcript_45237/g.72660  ORF Transcript_45237/g.72660 Transcript_45237/m.72660 type:complete len:260 (-) Transcript_45237:620-1399(-)
MLSTKQTAHTHLFGWMQHAYTKRRLSINSKQKRDSKTRHMQKPEIPNAYFANGASADYRGADEDDDSTGVKISGKYVGLLAALMDEVDLTECLIASLEYKIRQWHKDYCRRASDHVGIATAGTYQQGVNGTKDSGMLAVSGGGVGDGSSEQVDEIRSTSLAAVEHLAGSSDLGDVLSDMVRGRIILNGTSRSSVFGQEYDADTKARYLKSFLTTAGIMLRTLKQTIPIFAKLGPSGMTGNNLLEKRRLVSDDGTVSIKR